MKTKAPINKIPIKFHNIPTKDRARWRATLSIILASLPEEELKYVPGINIHKTLLSALYNTFDESSEQIDDLAKHYYNISVWAFAHLCENERFSITSPRRLERIALVSKDGIPPVQNIPTEVTVFHEIGHFYVQGEKNIVLIQGGNMEMKVELMCDRYSIMAYSRMLEKFPNYAMINTNKKMEKFNKYIKHTMNVIYLQNKKRDIIKRSYMCADKVMKNLKWKKIYVKCFVKSPGYNSP